MPFLRLIIILLIVSVTNPAISSAEEALVFSCTPGNHLDVVMQLKKVDSDSWEGSYF